MTAPAAPGTRRIIITGGPGSGKSTLLDALRTHGFICYQEVSRQIIRQEATRPDGVLPWNDLPAFARLAFREMMRHHDQAAAAGRDCFFDRGVPDIFGYLLHGGYAIPETFLAIHAQSCRYHPTVFMLPFWPEIYVNDPERPQTAEQSRSLSIAIGEAYRALGYTLVDVPLQPVAERVRFLLSRIGGPSAPAAGDPCA